MHKDSKIYVAEFVVIPAQIIRFYMQLQAVLQEQKLNFRKRSL